MLDLIEYRMHKGQVGCRKLSGHLSIDKRDEASGQFAVGSLRSGVARVKLVSLLGRHDRLLFCLWNERLCARSVSVYGPGCPCARKALLPRNQTISVPMLMLMLMLMPSMLHLSL